MRTLVFEVRGEYALFKKPYSPMSPVSYPFPPPPAVLGMLGAIAGYAKSDYLERLGWQQVRIAVQVLRPLRTWRAGVNWLQTKSGTDSFFRPKAGENTHSQIPHEFLRDVAFRIYVAQLPPPAEQHLEQQLAAGRSEYSVTLGLANCLAELTWIGATTAQQQQQPVWSSRAVLPLHTGLDVDYQPHVPYQRLRMPVVMNPQRQVQRYQEVLLAPAGQSIEAQGALEHVYTVFGESVLFL